MLRLSLTSKKKKKPRNSVTDRPSPSLNLTSWLFTSSAYFGHKMSLLQCLKCGIWKRGRFFKKRRKKAFFLKNTLFRKTTTKSSDYRWLATFENFAYFTDFLCGVQCKTRRVGSLRSLGFKKFQTQPIRNGSEKQYAST